jgi:hypothetical protein
MHGGQGTAVGTQHVNDRPALLGLAVGDGPG